MLLLLLLSISFGKLQTKKKKESVVARLLGNWTRRWLAMTHVCWCLNKCRSNKKSEEKTVTSVTHSIFLAQRIFDCIHAGRSFFTNNGRQERTKTFVRKSLQSEYRQHTKSEGNNKETGDIFTNRKKTKNSSPLLWPGVYISVRKL
jgi:hypothetical protein